MNREMKVWEPFEALINLHSILQTVFLFLILIELVHWDKFVLLFNVHFHNFISK